MSLASSLVALGDGTLTASFEGLRSHIDVEWIEWALAQNGVATLRRRKLPAPQVVWLVIGMALYRDRPIPEVVHRLNLVMPAEGGERQTIAKGALPPARDRVGAEPLRALFGITVRGWAEESADRHRWRGLRVLGADGVTLRVPDSAQNREAFHLPGSSRRSAGYPQIRAVGLMVLRSHLLLDFDFADCRTSEVDLAGPLLQRVPSQSLTVLDRYFVNYFLLHQLRAGGEERHWLVRAKRGLKWKVLKCNGRGDHLVEIEFPYTVRRAHPELPRTFLARAIRYQRKGFQPRVLLTSLLSPEAFPATEIAELYHERWELEVGYDEIKTHTLERMEALRSQTPERIRQEVWGLAVAYNLVRREMEAVAAQWKLPPRRISFRGALVLIRDLFIWAATASPGSLPKMIEGMRLDMQQMILPERRSGRRYPRHVKIKMSNYARNDGHPA